GYGGEPGLYGDDGPTTVDPIVDPTSGAGAGVGDVLDPVRGDVLDPVIGARNSGLTTEDDEEASDSQTENAANLLPVNESAALLPTLFSITAPTAEPGVVARAGRGRIGGLVGEGANVKLTRLGANVKLPRLGAKLPTAPATPKRAPAQATTVILLPRKTPPPTTKTPPPPPPPPPPPTAPPSPRSRPWCG
ncbi:hypothetical protein K525DRAFT_275563, partial [Schizophyllum commune Loenen D]